MNRILLCMIYEMIHKIYGVLMILINYEYKIKTTKRGCRIRTKMPSQKNNHIALIIIRRSLYRCPTISWTISNHKKIPFNFF